MGIKQKIIDTLESLIPVMPKQEEDLDAALFTVHEGNGEVSTSIPYMGQQPIEEVILPHFDTTPTEATS